MDTITKLNENFSAAPQIEASDLTAIAAAGFRSVICNRPDGEGGAAQPGHDDIKARTAQLGMQFAYLPVVPNQISADQVAQFKQLVEELSGPVLGVLPHR